MKGKKEKLMKEAVRELEQGISLVKAPSVLQQDPSLTLPKIKVKVSQQQSEENHAAMEEQFYQCFIQFLCVVRLVLHKVLITSFLVILIQYFYKVMVCKCLRRRYYKITFLINDLQLENQVFFSLNISQYWMSTENPFFYM